MKKRCKSSANDTNLAKLLTLARSFINQTIDLIGYLTLHCISIAIRPLPTPSTANLTLNGVYNTANCKHLLLLYFFCLLVFVVTGLKGTMGIVTERKLIGALCVFCCAPIIFFGLIFSSGNTSPMIIPELRYEPHNNHKQFSILRSIDRTDDPAFNLDPSPHKKIIIMVTGFRSGSSFLGNLFDGNPAIHYLFEPFHDNHIRTLRKRKLLIGEHPRHHESDLRMLYLQQLLHNCTAFASPFATIYGRCGTEEENWRRFNSSACNITQAEDHRVAGMVSYHEICKYRNTTAIKVIRLEEVSDILKITKIKSADVRVIQLLRHPVALTSSRRKFRHFFYWNNIKAFENSIRGHRDKTQRKIRVAFESFKYCSDHLKTLELAESDAWLKARLKTVTHSSMSLRPLKTAKMVYSFVNETLTDQVKQHMANISLGLSDGYNNSRDDNDPLNVYRNSTALVDEWRELEVVEFLDVYSIESQCKKLFGSLEEGFSTDHLSRRKSLQIYSDINSELDRVRLSNMHDLAFTNKIKIQSVSEKPLESIPSPTNTTSISVPSSSSPSVSSSSSTNVPSSSSTISSSSPSVPSSSSTITSSSSSVLSATATHSLNSTDAEHYESLATSTEVDLENPE